MENTVRHSQSSRRLNRFFVPIESVSQPQAFCSRINAGEHHVQEIAEFVLGIEIAAEPLQSFRRIERLTRGIEVAAVILIRKRIVELQRQA